MVHRYTESEGNIETWQYTMKTEGPFKKLRNLCTISIWNDRCFLRNLCTACSGTHSLIPHTYTAMYVYTYTAAHIPAQLCTYVRTYVHVLKVVCECIRTYTSMHTGPWEHNTYLYIVWGVILCHVGGLASESSAYTMYGIPHNSTALKISVCLGTYIYSFNVIRNYTSLGIGQMVLVRFNQMFRP